MLRLIRNNNPFTVIILFIFSLLIKFRVLVHPVLPVFIPNHFLFNYILKGLIIVFDKSAFWYILLAVVNLFLQSIYIVNITAKHKLFAKVTYVPSYVYLVLTSIFPVFNVFGETIILNWLLLGAVDIMFGFSQTNQPRKLIFNAGFLLCLAALFQFSLLAFFLLLLIAMVMFRSLNISEWAVAVMGFLTPVYFSFGLLFLAGKMYLLYQWVHIGFSFIPVVGSPIALIVTIAGLCILLISGVYALQLNIAISNIYIRRNWIVITFYLIISILVGFITDATIVSAWLIVIPALSIIVAHALLNEKNKGFSNFIFYFSLLFILFCLWANKK